MLTTSVLVGSGWRRSDKVFHATHVASLSRGHVAGDLGYRLFGRAQAASGYLTVIMRNSTHMWLYWRFMIHNFTHSQEASVPHGTPVQGRAITWFTSSVRLLSPPFIIAAIRPLVFGIHLCCPPFVASIVVVSTSHFSLRVARRMEVLCDINHCRSLPIPSFYMYWKVK